MNGRWQYIHKMSHAKMKRTDDHKRNDGIRNGITANKNKESIQVADFVLCQISSVGLRSL